VALELAEKGETGFKKESCGELNESGKRGTDQKDRDGIPRRLEKLLSKNQRRRGGVQKGGRGNHPRGVVPVPFLTCLNGRTTKGEVRSIKVV